MNPSHRDLPPSPPSYPGDPWRPVDPATPDPGAVEPAPRVTWSVDPPVVTRQAHPLDDPASAQPSPAVAASAASAAGATGAVGSSRRRSVVAPLLAIGLIAGVASSGGTVLALSGAGLLDRPAVVPTSSSTASQTAYTLSNAQDIDAATEAVVQKVAPSVVTITSQVQATRRFGGSQTETGVGSGVIVDAKGDILTNRHVVEGATSLTVTLSDGTDHPATVVKISDTTDLAVVRIDPTGLSLTPATLASSDSVAVGQTAIAIGSPLGEFTETVTRGIISATDRTIDVSDPSTGSAEHLTGLLQTDAAINPGNSGGPLVDLSGQVVGLNTAVASSSEGIGFAIPISAAASLVASAGAAA